MSYSYMTANYGDNYGYAAGGILSGIRSVVGAVTKVASKVLPGPVGAAAGAVSKVLGPSRAVGPPMIQTPPPLPQVPAPGPVAAVQRFVPGGATGYMPAPLYRGYHYNKALMRYERALAEGRMHQDPRSEPRVKNPVVKNRRMNPANPRALRRAIRREQAFVALAKRTLKGTGITVKRSSSFARKRRA